MHTVLITGLNILSSQYLTVSPAKMVIVRTEVQHVFFFFPFNRLLVQLEETERTFDDFWFSHSARLRQCLELRRFEQDFRELQVWL